LTTRQKTVMPNNHDPCEDESRLVLTERDAQMLFDLLLNPPPHNAKFLAAMERYEQWKAQANLAAAKASRTPMG
jgi:uncharacterized protein (DUF1778 family)